MASAARRAAKAVIVGLAASLAVVEACDEDRAPNAPEPAPSTTSGAGGDFLPGTDSGPPPLDAAGLCGNQIHETVIDDAPNVYFVIDVSGSMSAPASPGSSSTRAERVHKAAVSLVKDLGALINVGAAVFPHGATDDEPCAVGAQVMAVQPGDPGGAGPTTNELNHETDVPPFGGTPTSATLNVLRPALAALPGRTFVLLVTDGGPNCNAAAECGADGCIANIEGCSGFDCCSPGGNCCAPGEEAGPEGCLDDAATIAAVKAYADADLSLHVIGIPGSETYHELLSEMAVAAGTSQLAKPYYYAVEDLDELGAVLGQIAAVAISCVFEVNDPPEQPDQTNVYLDGAVLPADLQDGWRWMDPDLKRIELLGAACAALKSGKVKTVQIVSGCPTETPR